MFYLFITLNFCILFIHWHTGRGLWRHRHVTAWRGLPDLVLFDRDGTLVYDVPYNADPALVRPMPGAKAALESGYTITEAAERVVFDPLAWYSGSGSNLETNAGSAFKPVITGAQKPEQGLATFRDYLGRVSKKAPPV